MNFMGRGIARFCCSGKLSALIDPVLGSVVKFRMKTSLKHLSNTPADITCLLAVTFFSGATVLLKAGK
jgi:hypothetical protein